MYPLLDLNESLIVLPGYTYDTFSLPETSPPFLHLGAKLPLNGVGHYLAITDYTIFLLSHSTESYLANSK